MAELRSYGWVISNFVPKKSARQQLYIRFNLAERIGFGESAHTQYYDVWAWGQIAQSLIDQSVKKGSFLWVRGSLELVDFTWRDGVTKDKRLKLKLVEWRSAQGEKSKSRISQPKETGASQETADPGPAVVDGEREALPE